MKNVMKLFTVLGLALIIAAPLAAQEEQKKKRKNQQRQGGNQLVNTTMKRLEKAELTDEQKAKIKEMAKAWQAKIQEASKAAAITKEQRAKLNEARKKLNEEGTLKGKKLNDAVRAAGGLSDEQKAAMVKSAAVRQKFNQEVNAILTDEQKKKAGIRVQNAKRKAQAKKKKAAESTADK